MNSSLSEEELRRIFVEDIRDDLFTTASPSKNPALVCVGAQPGAGKTVASERIVQQRGLIGLLPIIGDELRLYHPDYDLLLETDPLRMPAVTAAASGRWVEMAIEHAQASRHSVLIEGTFRRATVTLRTVNEFHAAGFETQLVALAVPATVSRLSAMTRYVDAHREGQAARWADLAAHEAGYHGAALTLSEAARSISVDRLTVITRDGTPVFDAARPAALDGGVIALEHGRTTPLQPEAAQMWLNSYREGHEYLRSTGQINETTAPLLNQLAQDAIQIQDQAGRSQDQGSAAMLHQSDFPRPATDAVSSRATPGRTAPAKPDTPQTPSRGGPSR